jgi:hypothetical protein
MDREKRKVDREERKKHREGEKDDRYEIERGNEPHKEEDFPDDEEDQTR